MGNERINVNLHRTYNDRGLHFILAAGYLVRNDNLLFQDWRVPQPVLLLLRNIVGGGIYISQRAKRHTNRRSHFSPGKLWSPQTIHQKLLADWFGDIWFLPCLLASR
jgi:uncharacterized membrane protein YsdA (DUF1294 family)